MERISTLDCPGATQTRADGNTTRQVNFAIDHLFKGYEVHIKDHWQEGESNLANNFLCDKIMNRLLTEHRFSARPESDISFDRRRMTLSIKT